MFGYAAYLSQLFDIVTESQVLRALKGTIEIRKGTNVNRHLLFNKLASKSVLDQNICIVFAHAVSAVPHKRNDLGVPFTRRVRVIEESAHHQLIQLSKIIQGAELTD